MPRGIQFLSFCSSVRMFVRLSIRTSVMFVEFASKFCFKVSFQSFASSGVYLSNYLSESIHIWTIVTLEGGHSLYDHAVFALTLLRHWT